MKKNTTAHVIIIGDEILYGHTMDTNSHFLAKEFSNISIDLIQISAIQDKREDIKDEIHSSTADIILTTGGLGPTRDDRTKYVLSEILNQPLEMHAQALRWTEEYFQKTLNRPMNSLNKNQALVPVGTIPIRNKVGTAPGLWAEYGRKLLISLPGVPFEMKYLMKNEILPRLLKKYEPTFIEHEFVQTLNISESELAEILRDYEQRLPNNIKLAYLPRGNKIKLRLTGKGDVQKKLQTQLSEFAELLISAIPEENFLSQDALTVETIVGELLLRNNKTISTAESFTSGKIAAALTSISGSSRYFKGGIIAYSPELKERLLDVSKELMDNKGVASAEVALEMARGARENTQCDIGISSTGVAGPSNDSYGVEPGVAFIAISSKEKERVYEFNFPHLDRKDFTLKMTEAALQKLYIYLKNLD